MGMMIFTTACLAETIFLIWSFTTKDGQDKWKEAVRAGGLALLFLLLLAKVLRGFFRYAFFAGVLAIQVLWVGIRLYRKKEVSFRKGKWILKWIGNMLLYGICLLPAIVFPQYKEPVVTGSYAVKLAEYTWEDESRMETYTDTGENRSLTVKFWYPAEEGSYPLVVFSHGAFGVIDSNYSTCKELASNGYVVASIGHPYHAMFVEDVNGRVTMADREFIQQAYTVNDIGDFEVEEKIYAYSKEWMEIRTGDENFVLDTILQKAAKGEEGPFSMVDAEKIGLFGHSMGGASSVQLGRERDDIDAVINLDGTMLGEYTGYEDGVWYYSKEPYPIPLLDVTSRAADNRKGNPGGPVYVNFYVGENAVDYHYTVFEDAGHLNFTDLPLVSPPLARMLGCGDVDALDCIENVNEMVLHFFDYYLKGKKDSRWEAVY